MKTFNCYTFLKKYIDLDFCPNTRASLILFIQQLAKHFNIFISWCILWYFKSNHNKTAGNYIFKKLPILIVKPLIMSPSSALTIINIWGGGVILGGIFTWNKHIPNVRNKALAFLNMCVLSSIVILSALNISFLFTMLAFYLFLLMPA